MKNPEQNITAHRSFRRKGYDIYVLEFDRETKTCMEFTRDGMKDDKPFSIDGSGPLMTLDEQEAQILVDSLWSCGLRPTESAPTEGCMRVMQAHIDSLERQLARTLGQADLLDAVLEPKDPENIE